MLLKHKEWAVNDPVFFCGRPYRITKVYYNKDYGWLALAPDPEDEAWANRCIARVGQVIPRNVGGH